MLKFLTASKYRYINPAHIVEVIDMETTNTVMLHLSNGRTCEVIETDFEDVLDLINNALRQ